MPSASRRIDRRTSNAISSFRTEFEAVLADMRSQPRTTHKDLHSRKRSTRLLARQCPSEIRDVLESRRRELLERVRDQIREVRAPGEGPGTSAGNGTPEEDVRPDLELALLELNSRMLTEVDSALRRLDRGGYGECRDCGKSIAAKRLRALPFALRCKQCEEARERSDGLRVSSAGKLPPAIFESFE